MKNIEISQEDYEKLIEDGLLLSALLQSSVEGWEGYEKALRLLQLWKDE